MDTLQLAIQQAAELINQARHGVILTGAGISTPSGIPDFRSTTGLWKRYNPLEVATLSAFRYRPENFFAWLREIARDIHGALPNPAHQAIFNLQQAGYIHTIVTQNVDGLHQAAGCSQVLEVHGTMTTATCIRCYQQFSTRGILDAFLSSGDIPRCQDCGGILKPDIILFEEQLPYQTWQKAQQACRGADLIVVAGSSLEVMPVAGLPLLSVENGAPLIVINQTPTYLDVRATTVIHHNVAEILPRIAAQVLAQG